VFFFFFFFEIEAMFHLLHFPKLNYSSQHFPLAASVAASAF